MMRFEWNSLRVGDSVRLHPNWGALERGTVEIIDSRRGSNGVGIRAEFADGNRVSWPPRLAVHAATGDTDDPGEPCLRCRSVVAERT